MNPSDAIEAIEKPLSSLPYSLSRHILEHLRKITRHETVNGGTLANHDNQIVFGTTNGMTISI